MDVLYKRYTYKADFSQVYAVVVSLFFLLPFSIFVFYFAFVVFNAHHRLEKRNNGLQSGRGGGTKTSKKTFYVVLKIQHFTFFVVIVVGGHFHSFKYLFILLLFFVENSV